MTSPDEWPTLQSAPFGTFLRARTLVLGASGFVGRWVARALSLVGADVSLAVRNTATIEHLASAYGLHGTVHQIDVSDATALAALVKEIRPAVTFNLVGYGVDRSEQNETDGWRINAELVERLCRVVAEGRDLSWPGPGLVHVGSALEYGVAGGDLAEDSVPRPRTWYGKTKLAGTEALTRCSMSLGIPTLTARLFTVYGPGENAGRLLPSLVHAADTNTTVELTAGTQQRDFTYVQDVAEGLLRLALVQTEPGDVVNLATGKLASVRDFAEIAARILHLPSTSLRFGERPTRPEEMAHDDVAIHRLRKLTGGVPQTGIAEGVRQTLAFVKHGHRGATHASRSARRRGGDVPSSD